MKRYLIGGLILLGLGLALVAYALSSGPNSPGTMADDATVGTVAWTNPDNAKVSDNVYATVALLSVQRSHYLKATNFGFSIPVGATVDGILVEAEGKVDVGSNTWRTKIVKSDGTFGATQIDTPGITTTEGYTSIPATGASTNLWGETWTPTDINNSNFGVGIFLGFASGQNFSVDHIRITIYYTEAPASGGAQKVQVRTGRLSILRGFLKILH